MAVTCPCLASCSGAECENIPNRCRANGRQRQNTCGSLLAARVTCTIAGSAQAPANLRVVVPGLHGCRAKGALIHSDPTPKTQPEKKIPPSELELQCAATCEPMRIPSLCNIDKGI
eukprot:5227867-Amphidinium_carterae.8